MWPEPSSPYPPSVIPTLEPGKPLRMAYGSCRTSVSHDRAGNLTHGVDAMRAYALRMAAGEDDVRWPDFVLFLGDQVYADETSSEMEEFIYCRRDITEPPWDELKDYEEYTHLYKLAWSDPANRWLLSTLPSLMIFDDHDIRDDWNTSIEWKQKMEATSWWHERIVSGLGSYWVYQHLGNSSLPPSGPRTSLWQPSRAIPQRARGGVGRGRRRRGRHLRAGRRVRRASRPAADDVPLSFTRDIDDVRLVVVDSRAARVLEPENRSMLDPDELAWLDEQMQGGFRHLLVGTSSCSCSRPACTTSRPGTRRSSRAPSGTAEPASASGCARWSTSSTGAPSSTVSARSPTWPCRWRTASAGRPDTVTFLSGDVHHSYVSEVRRVHERSGLRAGSCRRSARRSATRCRAMRFATAFLSYGLAGPMGAVAAKSAHVPDPPFTWGLVNGPWFDNNLAVLEDKGPEGLAWSGTPAWSRAATTSTGWTRWPRQCSRPARPSTATGSRGRCPGA